MGVWGVSGGGGIFDRLSEFVCHCTDSRPVLRRKRADTAQYRGQLALLAQVLDLQRIEGIRVDGRGDHRQGPIRQAMQIAAHRVEVHVRSSLHAAYRCPARGP